MGGEEEKAKARQARAVQRAARREIRKFNQTSDLGERGVDANGDGNVDFFEWQRAEQEGTRAKSNISDEAPAVVQKALKRMKERGFTSSYFFHQCDNDRNGFLTRGEFERGLESLRIQ